MQGERDRKRTRDERTGEHAPILEPGTSIDQFKVMRLHGRGGMGEVYLVRDTKLGRRAALKIVSSRALRFPEARAAFQREAETIARFSHPHIVQVYAVGEHEGRPWVALEYLEGENLATRIKERHLGLAESLRIALATAQALAEAHRHGVLHLDLKPANIVMATDGRPRVVDFGLAVTDPTAAAPGTTSPTPDRSESGRVWGTPAYTAPERWGTAPPTAAADVWGLGVILFELCAGALPFDAETVTEGRAAIRGPDPAPRLDTLVDVPTALADLVARCLDKNPIERPHAEEVATQLERLLDARRGIGSSDDGPFRGLLPFDQRHAHLFFGREAEIDAFVERMRTQPVLAVVGRSGAGKTSFVHAGVIPRLREQEAWIVLQLAPGSHPFENLADRLRRRETQTYARSGEIVSESIRTGARVVARRGEISGQKGVVPLADAPDLASHLRKNPRALSLALRQIAEEERSKVLLAVDRLEELFTMSDDPHDQVRRKFMQAICTAADDPLDPIRVIVTVRDDYLGRLTLGPEARDALAQVTVVQRMDADALTDVLRKPVEAVGYAWEDPELPRAMAEAVVDEPGYLPLLQFAGETLWEGRDESRRLILRSAYERMGGIEGALARHAEAVLHELSPTERRIARDVLLSLVTPERTRKTVPVAQLRDALPAEAEPVISRLASSRLLSITYVREANRTETRVQLAHESLIVAWGTLSRWLDESREEVAFLTDATLAAELWDKRGRRPEELWRTDALRDASRLLKRVGREIPAIVEQFLDAGRARQRRRARRRRIMLGSVVVSALLAATTAIAVALWVADKEREALRQRNEAQAQREAAQRQTAIAKQQRAVALREAARAALGHGRVLEARAKLRVALEQEDGATARALWWQLASDPARWEVDLGTFGVALAFAPDGATVATGCQDAAVCIVDVDTAMVRILRGHEEKVSAVAYAHDGLRLATGDWDAGIRVWDLQSGAVLQTLRGHADRVEALAFTPDDRVLASAGRDHTIRLWDLGTWSERATLTGHTGGIQGLSVSPDGRTLASSSEDRTIRRWDITSGRELAVLVGHEGLVEDVAFSPRGSDLASAGNEGTIRIWDTRTDELVRVLSGHAGGVRGLSFSPDGRRLASGGYDNSIRIWNVASGETERVITGHAASVRSVAFRSDGHTLASASYDDTLRLWDLDVRQAATIEEGHAGAVRGVDISPDGRLVASGGFDRAVRLWDLQSGEPVAVLQGHTSAVYAVQFSPDGARLASAGSEGEVRIWTVVTGKQERALSGPGSAMYAVAFSPDGSRIATGSRDGIVRLWDLETGAMHRVLLGHEHTIWDLAFDHSGRRVAAASWDHTVRVWNAATGAPLARIAAHEGPAHGVSFSPDDRFLATSGVDGTIRRHDLTHAEEDRIVATIDARAYVLRHDPRGERIAVATSDGSVHVWSLADGHEQILPAHSDDAITVAWSRDGQRLATVGDDGTVRVWDMERGRPHWRAPILRREPARLLSHRGWIAIDASAPPVGESAFDRAMADVRFAEENPDATIACVQTHDGAVQLWDLQADAKLVDRPMPGLRRVAAIDRGCVAQGDEGVRLVTRATAPLLVDGPTEAIGVGPDAILVATRDRVLVFDAAGRPTTEHAVAIGVSAATKSEDFVVVGYRDGTIAAFAIRPGAAQPTDVFEQVSSGAVTRLIPGPMQTVIAGYANGTLAMWSMTDGVRLAHARLHGPVVHLLRHRHRLFAATDLGRHLVWDLGVFHRNYCGLLHEIWSQVPVIWHDGRAIERSPPNDHDCR